MAGVDFNATLLICKALRGGAGVGVTSDVARENGGANGTVLVAAAGNDGDSTVSYPAGYAEVVSVAATDQNDARASFSNSNADVEVAAPGVDILFTIPGGQYARLSGTSMATPHASGVTGVLWQLFPTDNAAGIRNRLEAAVDDIGPAGRDQSFGFGRVTSARRPAEAAEPQPGAVRAVAGVPATERCFSPPPSRHHHGAGRLHR